MLGFALLSLAALALAGCSSAVPGSAATACQSPMDCLERCKTAGCAAAMNLGARHLDVEITPPSSSPYVRTQKLDLSLAAGDATLDLIIPPPAEYQISVFDAAYNKIDASITLKGKLRIPGRELELMSDVRSTAERSPSIRLLEGSYDALVVPFDKSQPGLSAGFTARAPSTDPVRKEFRFPEYRKLFGVVTWSLARAHVISGASITAFSTMTGLPSTSTVSGEGGTYQILLPATDDTNFKLVATLPPEEQPAWGYEEIVSVGRALSREKVIPLEPTSDEIRGKAQIRIGGSGNGFVPVAGATVTLTATGAEGLATRTFRVQAMTDLDGYVVVPDATGAKALRILKARYVVDIEPAIDSRFARTSTTLDLTRIGPFFTPDIQILLGLRTAVDGSIRSSQGRVVPYARLSFLALDSNARAVDVTTDDRGDFDLWLAPGRYLLIVSPNGITASDDFPPVSVRMIEIAKGKARDSQGTIALPRGGLVRGTVRGQDTGLGIANAKVEFFHEVAGQAVSLGSTKTDAQGQLAIVLPEPSP